MGNEVGQCLKNTRQSHTLTNTHTPTHTHTAAEFSSAEKYGGGEEEGGVVTRQSTPDRVSGRNISLSLSLYLFNLI